MCLQITEKSSPYVASFLEKAGFPDSGGLADLALLKGRKLPAGEQAGPLRPFGVDFDPKKYVRFEEECAEVSEGLGSVFVPVANVGNGVAILLAGECGHYVMVGFAEPGVLYAGKGIVEALTGIVHGFPSPVLRPTPSSWEFEYDMSEGDAVLEFERGRFLGKVAGAESPNDL